MSSGSSQAPNASSPDWDPLKQSFTLLFPNGKPFNVPIPALDDFISYNSRICANFGCQLGASLLLLVVLAMLTGREKRRSPIFITNMLSLVLNSIRCFLQILYFTGPWSEVYAFLSGDYSRVPTSSYANSIAAEVFALLLLVAVEISLVMQSHVICATMREVHRYIVSFACAVVALIAIGLRFALMVMSIKSTLTASPMSLWWLASGSNIMTTISICIFCAVFVIKLGFAVLQRRKLGLKQFGPMQIVFIMGCQTLIVPATFSILTYFVDFPGMASLTLTLVAMLVPLSSMWASASVAGPPSQPYSSDYESRNKLFSSYASGTVNSRRVPKPLSPSFATTTRVSHSTMASPSSPGAGGGKWDPQSPGMEVMVDRTISVRSE
ncbi:MAG: hypothetical protein M1839_001834 [Geoglossum umbratile]|nr:MAG: hypothetical protein M1839_001834 [Geoglossum umbratile]